MVLLNSGRKIAAKENGPLEKWTWIRKLWQKPLLFNQRRAKTRILGAEPYISLRIFRVLSVNDSYNSITMRHPSIQELQANLHIQHKKKTFVKSSKLIGKLRCENIGKSLRYENTSKSVRSWKTQTQAINANKTREFCYLELKHCLVWVTIG